MDGLKLIHQDDPNFLSGLPKILYKYRDWEIDFHRDLILKHEIYFSSFDQLNDPFEGSIPFRYNPEDLTIENLHLKYQKMRLESNPNATLNEIASGWNQQLKNQWWNNDVHLKNYKQEIKRKLNETYGVFSLCKRKDNYLLWSYYSRSHKGICIGLNTKKLATQLQCTIGEVGYEKELPYLGIFENPFNISQKLLATKGAHWSHEEELRLRKFNFARKALKITPDTIEEIIFGVSMSDAVRNDIMALASKINPQILFYRASLNESEFKLDITSVS